MKFHGARYRYRCECGQRSCDRELFLPVEQYVAMSERGTVLHSVCAMRGRRNVLERWGEAVVCNTAAKAMVA